MTCIYGEGRFDINKLFFVSIFNWSIVDLQGINCCCTAKWFNYIYVYTFGYWLWFSVLYNRILLFIHALYKSFYLPIPTLYPSFTALSPGNHQSNKQLSLNVKPENSTLPGRRLIFWCLHFIWDLHMPC